MTGNGAFFMFGALYMTRHMGGVQSLIIEEAILVKKGRRNKCLEYKLP